MEPGDSFRNTPPIGTNRVGRPRGLVLEQTQLITELRLLQRHLEQLEAEIGQIARQSREGQILASIPGIGPVQAAPILAAIGHIENVRGAAALKSYFGWAPTARQSGTTLAQVHLTRGGNRSLRKMLLLIVGNAIRMDCEWARLYARLVPLKCPYDERTRTYKGKLQVMGRVAGQMVTMMYALLKHDQELLARTAPGTVPSAPMLYDPVVHRAHRSGHYATLKPQPPRETLVRLPARRS
jgi:Transposase IS116/IS110/IS902 family